jgi:putative oxidoreductase
MQNFLTYRIARLLFAIPFGVFGIIHFMAGSDMAGMVPQFIPGGVVWVYLTGTALMGACVAIVAQIRVALVCYLLAGLLLAFALTVHLPGALSESPNAISNLLKDFSLAGGALFLAALYSGEPAPDSSTT